MPKKFTINHKSALAREREEAKKISAREEDLRRKENAKWLDNDKKSLRNAQKKAESEEKRRNIDARQAEKKAIREEEERLFSIKNLKPKITHFMIQKELEKTASNGMLGNIPRYIPPFCDSEQEDENLREKNREMLHLQEISASGLEKVVSNIDNLDISGGKTQSITYKNFESRKLPALKNRLTGLRHSQYKEILWSEWKQSPENPVNFR